MAVTAPRWPQASASGSLLADATRAARLRFWIVTIGVLVIAAFAGSSAYDVWRSYNQVISATQRELGNLAKALAEQAEGSLQLADLLLRETATWYADRAPRTGSAAGRQAGGLERQACRRCARSGSSTSTEYRAFDRERCREILPPFPTGRTSSLTATIRVSAWCSAIR